MKKLYSALIVVVMLMLLIPLDAFPHDQDHFKKLKFIRMPDPSPAPYFTVMNPEGRKIGMNDLKGKLVLLNFWATWCPPCRLEMPSMEKLYREYKGKGLEVVAMNFMEGLEPINKFLKENKFSFTVLLDSDAKVSERYGVHALPVTFLIGRKGNMLVRSIGYKDWHSEESRKFISSLLQDEAIINHGPAAEVKAGLAQGNNNEMLLIFGIAVLGFLVVSTLWYKGGWFKEK